MKNKRGQTFLFAAIIISVIIVSFGTVANQVTTTPEPKDLEDFSYEVKREAGKVIDYAIYSELDPNVKLDEFIDVLASTIREKDPDINFLFLYGTYENAKIRNYAHEGTVTACPENDVNCYTAYPGGSRISGSVSFSGTSQQVDTPYDIYSDRYEVTLSSQTSQFKVTLKIDDAEYPFWMIDSPQVIFIIQKESDEESFVYVR